MTTQDNPPVEVTQEDRVITANVWYPKSHEDRYIYARERILSGDMDHTNQVQSVAISRLASQRPAVGDDVVERVEAPQPVS